MDDALLVERRDRTGQPSGGGILAVVLDLSVAVPVLERAAAWAQAGCAPFTVLAHFWRPVGFTPLPFAPIVPCWTDKELIADALDALDAPLRAVGCHGRIELQMTLREVENAVTRHLRERDYVQVVVGSRDVARQRRRSRRIVSAASPYCQVEVL